MMLILQILGLIFLVLVCFLVYAIVYEYYESLVRENKDLKTLLENAKNEKLAAEKKLKDLENL